MGDEPAMRDWAAELVDRARSEGVELTGDGGLLTALVRQVLQTGLEVEMTDHVGSSHMPVRAAGRATAAMTSWRGRQRCANRVGVPPGAEVVDLRSGWSQAAGPMTAVDAWDAEFERCRREWVDATRIRVPRAWFDAYDAMTARHKELVDAGRWATGPRSLLGVLGDRSRETKHTVVLAWLLDPSGRHGLGTSLLEAVLHRVHPGTERSLARVRCGTEVECVSVVGFVDVVVWGEDWRLVIENKLWSTQHGDQLDRYHAEFADSSTTLVYLTPEGTRAWGSSPEITAAYRPLSWRRHVIPDLRDAIATTQPAPAVLDYLVALEEELG